jgi:hypothetical protein
MNSPMSDKVYIFDEIVVAQQDYGELRAAYLDQYVPSARLRGMTLDGAWSSPPIELPNRAMTLHFLWSVPDVSAWWAMRLSSARTQADLDVPIDGDEEKRRWWQYVDNMAISRKRTFMRDIPAGADV